MKRTMMVLLDYSKTYDKVWRHGQALLLDLHKMGVPPTILKWVYSFLGERSANVAYNGSYSRPLQLHQGLRQEAVLPPLLFLFYINL